MSETFLIKTTAFNDNGPIDDREAKSFVIGPGELNGPAGVARDTDLKLYGFGAPKWGEGINQNILRILENNACPAKELNDYNPSTGNFDYNPAIDPLLPKDENDLGLGNGITVAFIGQNWFNLSNNLMYTYSYNGSPSVLGWNSAGEGATFFGDVNMGGNSIANLANPVNAQDAMTLSYADFTYVNTAGDTMTGVLNMGSNRIEGVADPNTTDDALNLGYADARYMQLAGGGVLAADLYFTIPTPVAESKGIRWTGNTDLARIYVEGYAGTESSRLVLYMGDNGTSQDYISFMSNNAGVTTETLRIKGSAIEPQVPLNGTTISANTLTTNTLVVNSAMTVDADINFGNNVSASLRSPDPTCRIEFSTGGNIRDVQLISEDSAGFVVRGNALSGLYKLDAYVPLDMNSNKITDLATPTLATDAAHKSYVDDTVNAAVSDVTVVSGTIAHGGTIPLPAGYTHAQCQFLVAAGNWSNFGGNGRDGIDSFHVTVNSGTRVVTCYTYNGLNFTGTANYIIIGIK